MSFSGWLIAGSIFIIILTIALGIGWWLRNNNHQSPAPPTTYIAPFVWGQPTAGPNPAKNFCQLYQFPPAMVNFDGVPTVVPGTPTFNSNILNSMTGMTGYPSCLDSDQIMAQQLQHTCTAPNGVVDGSITRCFLMSGGTTGLGGTESYYSSSGCSNVSQCPGQLSVVSVNFQAPTVPNIFCIQNEGTGSSVTMQPCNPTNPDQLFRVTRVNPGQSPNSLQPGQGQNGLIAQILDRNTGLCLVPGTVTTSTIYSPSYITPVDSGCSGSDQTFFGPNVIMSTCTGGASPGYVWALLPSFPYCPVIGGCSGCGGCQGCSRILDNTNCTGCTACTGQAPLPVPPQIIYIGDLNLNNAPVGPTGYQGLTGPSALMKWLIDNNAQSLYYGGTGTGLILTDLGTDVEVCQQKPYTSQYLNITTYNTISAEEVCLANNTLATQNCVGL